MKFRKRSAARTGPWAQTARRRDWARLLPRSTCTETSTWADGTKPRSVRIAGSAAGLELDSHRGEDASEPGGQSKRPRRSQRLGSKKPPPPWQGRFFAESPTLEEEQALMPMNL